jgi:hypothetical protein
MAEEMMLENFPFESDEAEDWESDEAFIESDESAEDIGERSSRRRDRYRRSPRVRGARGMTVQGPNGPQRYQFPAKLATAAETNRGLASQEFGQRALAKRMDRLETAVRAQSKNDSSITGIVTLLIGGGLTVWGIIEVSRSGGFTFGKWAGQESTRMASLASVSQLATTGARMAIKGTYQKGFSTAADAFAGLQLAAFAFGSMYKPRDAIPLTNFKELQALQGAGTLAVDARYITLDSGNEYETFKDANGKPIYRLLH